MLPYRLFVTILPWLLCTVVKAQLIPTYDKDAPTVSSYPYSPGCSGGGKEARWNSVKADGLICSMGQTVYLSSPAFPADKLYRVTLGTRLCSSDEDWQVVVGIQDRPGRIAFTLPLVESFMRDPSTFTPFAHLGGYSSPVWEMPISVTVHTEAGQEIWNSYGSDVTCDTFIWLQMPRITHILRSSDPECTIEARSVIPDDCIPNTKCGPYPDPTPLSMISNCRSGTRITFQGYNLHGWEGYQPNELRGYGYFPPYGTYMATHDPLPLEGFNSTFTPILALIHDTNLYGEEKELIDLPTRGTCLDWKVTEIPVVLSTVIPEQVGFTAECTLVHNVGQTEITDFQMHIQFRAYFTTNETDCYVTSCPPVTYYQRQASGSLLQYPSYVDASSTKFPEYSHWHQVEIKNPRPTIIESITAERGACLDELVRVEERDYQAQAIYLNNELTLTNQRGWAFDRGVFSATNKFGLYNSTMPLPNAMTQCLKGAIITIKGKGFFKSEAISPTISSLDQTVTNDVSADYYNFSPWPLCAHETEEFISTTEFRCRLSTGYYRKYRHYAAKGLYDTEFDVVQDPADSSDNPQVYDFTWGGDANDPRPKPLAVAFYWELYQDTWVCDAQKYGGITQPLSNYYPDGCDRRLFRICSAGRDACSGQNRTVPRMANGRVVANGTYPAYTLPVGSAYELASSYIVEDNIMYFMTLSEPKITNVTGCGGVKTNANGGLHVYACPMEAAIYMHGVFPAQFASFYVPGDAYFYPVNDTEFPLLTMKMTTTDTTLNRGAFRIAPVALIEGNTVLKFMIEPTAATDTLRQDWVPYGGLPPNSWNSEPFYSVYNDTIKQDAMPIDDLLRCSRTWTILPGYWKTQKTLIHREEMKPNTQDFLVFDTSRCTAFHPNGTAVDGYEILREIYYQDAHDEFSPRWYELYFKFHNVNYENPLGDPLVQNVTVTCQMCGAAFSENLNYLKAEWVNELNMYQDKDIEWSWSEAWKYGDVHTIKGLVPPLTNLNYYNTLEYANAYDVPVNSFHNLMTVSSGAPFYKMSIWKFGGEVKTDQNSTRTFYSRRAAHFPTVDSYGWPPNSHYDSIDAECAASPLDCDPLTARRLADIHVWKMYGVENDYKISQDNTSRVDLEAWPRCGAAVATTNGDVETRDHTQWGFFFGGASELEYTWENAIQGSSGCYAYDKWMPSGKHGNLLVWNTAGPIATHQVKWYDFSGTSQMGLVQNTFIPNMAGEVILNVSSLESPEIIKGLVFSVKVTEDIILNDMEIAFDQLGANTYTIYIRKGNDNILDDPMAGPSYVSDWQLFASGSVIVAERSAPTESGMLRTRLFAQKDFPLYKGGTHDGLYTFIVHAERGQIAMSGNLLTRINTPILQSYEMLVLEGRGFENAISNTSLDMIGNNAGPLSYEFAGTFRYRKADLQCWDSGLINTNTSLQWGGPDQNNLPIYSGAFMQDSVEIIELTLCLQFDTNGTNASNSVTFSFQSPNPSNTKPHPWETTLAVTFVHDNPGIVGQEQNTIVEDWVTFRFGRHLTSSTPTYSANSSYTNPMVYNVQQNFDDHFISAAGVLRGDYTTSAIYPTGDEIPHVIPQDYHIYPGDWHLNATSAGNLPQIIAYNFRTCIPGVGPIGASAVSINNNMYVTGGLNSGPRVYSNRSSTSETVSLDRYEVTTMRVSTDGLGTYRQFGTGASRLSHPTFADAYLRHGAEQIKLAVEYTVPTTWTTSLGNPQVSVSIIAPAPVASGCIGSWVGDDTELDRCGFGHHAIQQHSPMGMTTWGNRIFAWDLEPNRVPQGATAVVNNAYFMGHRAMKFSHSGLDIPYYDMPADETRMAWILPSNISSDGFTPLNGSAFEDYQTIFAYSNRDTGNTILLSLRLTPLNQLQLIWDATGDTGTFTTWTCPIRMDMNEWHHVTYSRKGGMQYMYINGRQLCDVDTGVIPFESAGKYFNHITIGYTVSAGRDPHTFFFGEMYNIQHYNRALDDREIDILAFRDFLGGQQSSINPSMSEEQVETSTMAAGPIEGVRRFVSTLKCLPTCSSSPIGQSSAQMGIDLTHYLWFALGPGYVNLYAKANDESGMPSAPTQATQVTLEAVSIQFNHGVERRANRGAFEATLTDSTNQHTLQFSTLPSFHQARYGHVCVASEMKVYCLGGYEYFKDEARPLASMEMMDTSSSQLSWRRMPSMSAGRFLPAAVVAGDYIYVTGGRGDDNHAIQYMERFNVLTETWEKMLDMGAGLDRWGAGFAQWNGRFVLSHGKTYLRDWRRGQNSRDHYEYDVPNIESFDLPNPQPCWLRSVGYYCAGDGATGDYFTYRYWNDGSQITEEQECAERCWRDPRCKQYHFESGVKCIGYPSLAKCTHGPAAYSGGMAKPNAVIGYDSCAGREAALASGWESNAQTSGGVESMAFQVTATMEGGVTINALTFKATSRAAFQANVYILSGAVDYGAVPSVLSYAQGQSWLYGKENIDIHPSGPGAFRIQLDTSVNLAYKGTYTVFITADSGMQVFGNYPANVADSSFANRYPTNAEDAYIRIGNARCGNVTAYDANTPCGVTVAVHYEASPDIHRIGIDCFTEPSKRPPLGSYHSRMPDTMDGIQDFSAYVRFNWANTSGGTLADGRSFDPILYKGRYLYYSGTTAPEAMGVYGRGGWQIAVVDGKVAIYSVETEDWLTFGDYLTTGQWNNMEVQYSAFSQRWTFIINADIYTDIFAPILRGAEHNPLEVFEFSGVCNGAWVFFNNDDEGTYSFDKTANSQANLASQTGGHFSRSNCNTGAKLTPSRGGTFPERAGVIDADKENAQVTPGDNARVNYLRLAFDHPVVVNPFAGGYVYLTRSYRPGLSTTNVVVDTTPLYIQASDSVTGTESITLHLPNFNFTDGYRYDVAISVALFQMAGDVTPSRPTFYAYGLDTYAGEPTYWFSTAADPNATVSGNSYCEQGACAPCGSCIWKQERAYGDQEYLCEFQSEGVMLETQVLNVPTYPTANCPGEAHTDTPTPTPTPP